MSELLDVSRPLLAVNEATREPWHRRASAAPAHWRSKPRPASNRLRIWLALALTVFAACRPRRMRPSSCPDPKASATPTLARPRLPVAKWFSACGLAARARMTRARYAWAALHTTRAGCRSTDNLSSLDPVLSQSHVQLCARQAKQLGRLRLVESALFQRLVDERAFGGHEIGRRTRRGNGGGRRRYR